MAAAVLFVPSLAVRPSEQHPLLLLSQVVVAVIILGAGRQGLDVLGFRMVVAGLGAPLGLWVGGATSHPACTRPQSCFQWLALGVGFFALLVAVVLALVAVPTTVIWNKGVASLRPELPWSQVPRPRTWWQWVLLVVGVVAGLILLQVLLGIPSV